MNKKYGKIMAVIFICIGIQKSVYGFDRLMKTTTWVMNRSAELDSQLKRQCIPHQKMNDDRVILCNELLDKVDELLVSYISLPDELESYDTIPGVPEIRANIKTVHMNQLNNQMRVYWRPLRYKLLKRTAIKLHNEGVDALNLFIDRCGITNNTESKEKIDMCNDVLDAVAKTVPAMEMLSFLGYPKKPVKVPKRAITPEEINYWRSLQKKQ